VAGIQVRAQLTDLLDSVILDLIRDGRRRFGAQKNPLNR
jgi:hypothetical protein